MWLKIQTVPKGLKTMFLPPLFSSCPLPFSRRLEMLLKVSAFAKIYKYKHFLDEGEFFYQRILETILH